MDISGAIQDKEEIIRRKQKELRLLFEELEALRRAAAIMGIELPSSDLDTSILQIQSAGPPAQLLRKWPVAIGDACEQVLTKAGGPMHISNIAKEIAKLGVRPGKSTLMSGLIKDYRNRFKRLGNGIYDLKRDGDPGLFENMS